MTLSNVFLEICACFQSSRWQLSIRLSKKKVNSVFQKSYSVGHGKVPVILFCPDLSIGLSINYSHNEILSKSTKCRSKEDWPSETGITPSKGSSDPG